MAHIPDYLLRSVTRHLSRMAEYAKAEQGDNRTFNAIRIARKEAERLKKIVEALDRPPFKDTYGAIAENMLESAVPKTWSEATTITFSYDDEVYEVTGEANIYGHWLASGYGDTDDFRMFVGRGGELYLLDGVWYDANGKKHPLSEAEIAPAFDYLSEKLDNYIQTLKFSEEY